MLIFLLVLAAALVGFILILRRLGGGNFPWIQFYVKGRESGFIFKEVNLLRKVAVENRLENPISLFWSIKQLDRSIRGMVTKFRSENKDKEPGNLQFITKLYDFRKRVEFNLPKYKIGIKSSRQITPRQRIKLTLESGENFSASVVENLKRYMAISYPQGPKLPQGFNWKGQNLNIYFWRPDDAGYVFQSKVIEDYSEKKYPIIHIAHSDNLLRSQKRNSIRVETNRPASLYPLRSIESANEVPEKAPGLRSRLIDLSEGGAAILIGGKAKVGLPVKLQFSLGKNPLVMCGVVKGLTFSQKKNQSILHIQAVPLSPRVKSDVLSYVYNIFGERNEDAQKKSAPATNS